MATRTNKKQRLTKSTTTTNQLTKQTSHSNVTGHLGNKKDKKDSNHISSIEYDYNENIEWNTNPRVDLEQSKYGFHHKQNTLITTHHRELPTEIVIQIVDYISQRKDLKTCTLVNKQFYAIAIRFLWRSPRFKSKAFVKSFVDYLTNSQKQQQQDLPAVGRHIKTLSLEYRFWTDSSVLRLLPQVPNLEDLSLCSRKDRVSLRPLQSIPRHCPHLTSLFISGRRISESVIIALGQHCRQLGQLSLIFCDGIPPNTLELLASCPLESLTISFVPFGDHSNQHQLVVDLARYHRHQLTHLDLLYHSNFMVEALFTTCYNYQTVAEGDDNDNDNDNGNTSSNYPATITPPIMHWPRLTKLHLQNCQNVDDSIFIPFIKSNPQLQNLDFTKLNITDTALDVMATSLPLLIHLSLKDCDHISGAGARRFIVNSSDCLLVVRLSNCPLIAAEDLPGHRRTTKYGETINLLAPPTIQRLRETNQDT
ncbi:hypothetical protein BCR42DRAFT_494096, partial [Absidia repens]